MIRHATQAVKSLPRFLLSSVLPPSCVVCEVNLPWNEPMGICPKCYPELPRWDKTDPLMPELPARITSFNAPCLYLPPFDRLVPRLKYADGLHLVPAFAKLMAPCLPADGVLVPVPLHRKRLLSRKFNQAAELARSLAQHTHRTVDLELLTRNRATQSQVGQSASTRRRQLSGAFTAGPRCAGQVIVLIDDVWTTGSTAHACAVALHKAGAKAVHVVTLCYVPPK